MKIHTPSHLVDQLLRELPKEQTNAFAEYCGDADHCWRRPLPHQQLHPDGCQHQDDSKRRSCGRGLYMAIENRWLVDQYADFPIYIATQAYKALKFY